MAGETTKYLDSNGLLYYHGGLKALFPTSIAYDTTNHKFTMTKNGSTTDIVTAATLKTEMGLNNVGNFKAVSTEANQGLTETEQANARANIGAGASSFDGNFNSLSNKPTTISGYGITDAKIEGSTITLGSNTIKPVSTAASQGLTTTEQANARTNIGAGTSNFDGAFSSLSSKPTTLSGYGITDAKIENGTITLGSNSINLSTVYRYKGSKATYAALPSTGNEVGDVWNVTADGKNYAYTGETGNEWDDLGGTFTIDAITNAEIDTILAS